MAQLEQVLPVLMLFHVSGIFIENLILFNYLSQGRYVIIVVCVSVCLSVSTFAQTLANEFA